MGVGIKRDGSRAHLEFFSHIIRVLIICAVLNLVSWLFLGPW